MRHVLQRGQPAYQTKVDPITYTTMARIIGELMTEIQVRTASTCCGIRRHPSTWLWQPGPDFVREIFTGVYASDFGLWNTNAEKWCATSTPSMRERQAAVQYSPGSGGIPGQPADRRYCPLDSLQRTRMRCASPGWSPARKPLQKPCMSLRMPSLKHGICQHRCALEQCRTAAVSGRRRGHRNHLQARWYIWNEVDPKPRARVHDPSARVPQRVNPLVCANAR